MKRRVEIEQAAKATWDEKDYCVVMNGKYDESNYGIAFEDGARWADAHPSESLVDKLLDLYDEAQDELNKRCDPMRRDEYFTKYAEFRERMLNAACMSREYASKLAKDAIREYIKERLK